MMDEVTSADVCVISLFFRVCVEQEDIYFYGEFYECEKSYCSVVFFYFLSASVVNLNYCIYCMPVCVLAIHEGNPHCGRKSNTILLTLATWSHAP